MGNTAATEPADGRLDDLAFPLLVAEYSSLRTEIVAHLTLQERLTSGGLIALAALAAIAAKDPSMAIVLLFYPVLSLALAVGWRFHRDRTMQIADLY